MSFFDNEMQKADAKMATGRAQLDAANKGFVGGIPQNLGNADRLKLSKAGISKILEATMEQNRLKRKYGTKWK